MAQSRDSMANITFKSDPDLLKSMTKAEYWAYLKTEWPELVEFVLELKEAGMLPKPSENQRVRMYNKPDAKFV